MKKKKKSSKNLISKDPSVNKTKNKYLKEKREMHEELNHWSSQNGRDEDDANKKIHNLNKQEDKELEQLKINYDNFLDSLFWEPSEEETFEYKKAFAYVEAEIKTKYDNLREPSEKGITNIILGLDFYGNNHGHYLQMEIDELANLIDEINIAIKSE